MSICLSQIDHTKLNTIRALVVDEDAVYQNLLCRLLISHGIQVVGRASHLNEAVLLYDDARPDVILVDLSSNTEEKLNILSTIKEKDPLVKIVVLSILGLYEDIGKGRDSLIDAYIVKGSAARDIVSTVKRAIIGKRA